MTLGRAPGSASLFHATTTYCEVTLGPISIYRYLHQHGHRLFPDEAFADLFQDIGRESIPPQIVAVVMVLQRLEGLSDREAVDRFAFDLRWKYAAGGLDFDHPSFVHTVLVRMRARLRASERPNRIFEVALDAAREAGLVGRKRALDSTPLYDAVATQDTVTLVRSAIRGVLRVADAALVAALRGVLRREDDYAQAGKPPCDWNDPAARAALIDELCRDAHAMLAELHARPLREEVRQAAELLATVVGQDVEQDSDGCFRIARRVAPDRVISTVDPEARHGHKTQARGFDGYKGHVSIDPDSEIITATAVTPGNAGDGSVAETLLNEALLLEPQMLEEHASVQSQPLALPAPLAAAEASPAPLAEERALPVREVYGDASYGTGLILARLARHEIDAYVKVQPSPAPKGMFSKDEFAVALDAGTVTCPGQKTVSIQRTAAGGGIARFDSHCGACPLRAQCTSSAVGRAVRIHPQESLLLQARQRQRTDPEWVKRYRANRPKVERKLAHLVRRKHGGRRARMRGVVRVAWDFALLAAAVNFQRLARLLLSRQSSVQATLCPA